jgi:hypothetical protein
MASTDSEIESGCTCKVGTLAREYDFSDVNDELVARWTGATGEDESVRSLTDYFNRQLLRTELKHADVTLVEGRVENLYDLLTDDDRLEADRMQARSTLEGKQIDVDTLESQFVSHQTMYRHLRNCLSANKDRNKLSVEKERDRIHSVQHRAEAVVDDSVSRLRDGGKLDLGEYEVLINFRVICEDCGSLSDVTDIIEDGGCTCH